jgi:putative transposase
LWNAEKKADPGPGWWAENSKCAYQEAFRNLDGALGDFIKSKKGLRKGKRLGFPRRKKKGKPTAGTPAARRAVTAGR